MNYSALVLSFCTSEFWKEREREEVRKRLFPKAGPGVRGRGCPRGPGRAAGSRWLWAAAGLPVQRRVRLEFWSSDVTRRRVGKLSVSPL